MKKQIRIPIVLCIVIGACNLQTLRGMAAMPAPDDKQEETSLLHIRISGDILQRIDESTAPLDLELLVGLNSCEALTKKSFARLLTREHGMLLAVACALNQGKNSYHVYSGPEFMESFAKPIEPISSNTTFFPPIARIFYYLTPSADHSPSYCGSCTTYAEFLKNELLKLALDAARGVRDALYKIGFTYAIGTDKLSIDYPRAMAWYKKAARLGDSRAMLDLGALYCRGLGTDPDYQKTAYWWHQSADVGNTEALIVLGLLYANKCGFDTAPDLNKARVCYEEACTKNYKPQSPEGAELLQDLADAVRDVVPVKSEDPQ